MLCSLCHFAEEPCEAAKEGSRVMCDWARERADAVYAEAQARRVMIPPKGTLGDLERYRP